MLWVLPRAVERPSLSTTFWASDQYPRILKPTPSGGSENIPLGKQRRVCEKGKAGHTSPPAAGHLLPQGQWWELWLELEALTITCHCTLEFQNEDCVWQLEATAGFVKINKGKSRSNRVRKPWKCSSTYCKLLYKAGQEAAYLTSRAGEGDFLIAQPMRNHRFSRWEATTTLNSCSPPMDFCS